MKRRCAIFILAAAAAAMLTGCGERADTVQDENTGTEISAAQLIEEDGTEYSKAETYYEPEPESLGAELKEALSESTMIVEEPIS